MSAINNRQSKKSGMNSILLVGGIIGVGAVLLFAYLMFYTAPEENIEMVKVIAIHPDSVTAITLTISMFSAGAV